MAAKVLKLANSSYYGFRQKIANIPQAVTLLGFATLKNALLAAAVFDMFRLQGTGFDLNALWKHSITTATAAKLIAKRARYPQSEKAFTAALLHDVGKIILARFIPQGLAEIMDAVREDQLAMYDAEKKVHRAVPPGPGRVGAGALGPARPDRRGGRVPPPPDAGAVVVRPGRHRVPGEHPGPPLRHRQRRRQPAARDGPGDPGVFQPEREPPWPTCWTRWFQAAGDRILRGSAA